MSACEQATCDAGVGQTLSPLDRAIAELRAGGAVIFPTDTVYGLGVAVEHAPGPQAIYDLKRRDAGKPVAWLVGGAEDLKRYGRAVCAEALDLARRFWPGALTLVVQASDAVPPAFAPHGTIGLRMPANDTALALIRAVGPIATSSANRAGDAPARSFDDLDSTLVREASFALRGDAPATGTASTVVDLTTPTIRILRQGDIAV